MIVRFFKRNSILIGFSLIYLLLVVLAMVELDRQYYQQRKRTYITERYLVTSINQEIGGENLGDLEQVALEALRTNNPQAMQRLREQIWKILRADNFVYRIAIRPGDDQEVEGQPLNFIVDLPSQKEIEEKIAAHNSFANSLFLRDFSGHLSTPIVAGGRQFGRLYAFYTSPIGNPEIEEITRTYRWIALWIWLLITVLAVGLARSLLLPLRNVMSSLEASTPQRTHFIPRPRTRLESLYNRMALDAVIARMQGQLREEIARRPQMTGWEVVHFIVEAFRDQVGLALVACLEMVAEGPGAIRATGQRVIAGPRDWAKHQPELVQLIDDAMPRDGRIQASLLLDEIGLRGEGLVHLVADPERTGIRYLLALALERHLDHAAHGSLQNMLERLTELIEAGLQTLTLRNRLLVQERGRANISLSRNLGHDLTNIIATSKLELMALDRLLKGGQLPDDDRRRQILVESLHGLLRSVKFMQETVNLYRSYAFLQHPVLEVQDGNQLIGESMELFEISISAKVRLEQELAPDAPRCVVDPRLIKLALFNLFSNALEAIRKKDPERTAAGCIRVVTRRSAEGGLCVAVEDTGTGILNERNEPAQPHEIEKIFELGYTSFRLGGSHGEGLGLNWVRTIVQDLHGGSIFAENIEGAGARFVIVFPPVEQAPDLENTEMHAARYMRQIQGLVEEQEQSARHG
ncbi:MAG TPA: ATP-binding protein [Candidatus Sumerlaeota bacterium]|nr:ATP-binding protein [Candidatus Sumerlaeota bacterium]HPK00911.1 ATP-binding protein [Candidatus Sumerlaeota bacterium]